jgi:hypothetical protein
MPVQTEQIKLPDTGETHLPLGFRNIFMKKIPPRYIKSKLLVYNKKYKCYGMEVWGMKKPISKILK